jgi:glycosyltransferase involved in cell wall biosynthesis
MRLALITTDNREDRRDYSPELPWFGTAPQALLEGFASMPDQIEVHVVSCTREHLKSPLQLAPNITFHSVHVPSWAWMKTAYLGNILAVRRCLKIIQPDLVHGQGTERDCALAAVFSGYPSVLTLHGNMRVHAARHGNRHRLYLRLAAMLESLALRLANGVISISRYADALIAPLAKRSWLLPNAAQSSYFVANPASTRAPIILFVGTLDERKNPLGFIHACGHLISECGWKLRLCGSGDPTSRYVEDLKQLAAIHPWIELVGWKSREGLLTEMENASLLVLPTFEDNCPMVVLEAMATGLPVIASKVGGVPDLITEGETGMMFDPSNSDSIRTAVECMMEDPALRARIGRSAREQAHKRFHPHVVATSHMEIYKVIDRSSSLHCDLSHN